MVMSAAVYGEYSPPQLTKTNVGFQLDFLEKQDPAVQYSK